MKSSQITTESLPRSNAVAWCVGGLLAAAFVGMLHDRGYATASGMESVESGRDLETSIKESGIGRAASSRIIGLGCLVGAGVVCFATLPAAPRVRWDSLAWLTLFGLAWTGASSAWSEHPGTSVREFGRLAIYVSVAVSLASRFDLRRICFVLCIALGGSVLAAVGYEIVSGGFKPWQADYRLTGTLHSNALAIQSGVVAILCFAFALRGREHRAFWCALCLAALVIVYLTKTRTALVTVGVGLIVIYVVGRPARQLAFQACAAASVAALIALLISALNLTVERHIAKAITLGRSDGSNSDHSLTGRVPLWEFIWEETAGVRLQGVGYGSFWLRDRTEEANSALRWFPRQSHNSYIDIMAGIGFLGLTIALTVGVLALGRAVLMVNGSSGPEHFALIALLCAAFVNGISETAFVTPRDIGLVTATLIFSLVIQPAGQTIAVSASPVRSRRMRRERDATPPFRAGGSQQWTNS